MIKKIRNIKVKIHRKVEKKEEKKGLLEKNKNLLDSLVAIGTLFGFIYVIVVALFQYVYSIKAAKYYYLDWLYFLKEDLGLALHLSLVCVVGFFWFCLPFLPFCVERMHNHTVLPTEPNWSGKDTTELITHCFPFFVLDLVICIKFLSILSDTINWYYKKNHDAFRLGLCVVFVLFIVYVIQYWKLYRKEKQSIEIFDKKLLESIKNVFLNKSKIFMIVIFSLILYLVLSLLHIGDKAIQINNICIIIITIIVKIISFILAQLFYFGILSSKPEKYTGEQLEEKKENNDYVSEQNQSKEIKLNVKQFFAVLLWTLFSAIIISSVIYVCLLNLSLLNPKNKKIYEIVQPRITQDYEKNDEQKASDSILQVIILHRGSQVLLMNGSIEDEYSKKTISNPKEISSSSNLYLDISSYEIQDADKYIFYRRRFASVKRKYGDYLLDKDDEEKNNAE